jgi:hypothetical protein
MDHRWEIEPTRKQLDQVLPDRPRPTQGWDKVCRAPKRLLELHPVDVLVADHTSAGRDQGDQEPEWTALLRSCAPEARPGVVIEVWKPRWIVQPTGPLSKPRRKAMLQLGYQQRSTVIQGTQVGGAVDQQRLIVVYYNPQEKYANDIGGRDWCLTTDRRPRPMSNLLRPVGLVPRRTYWTRSPPDGVPIWNIDPMPDAVGRLIQDARGVRRLLGDELAKALGVPKEWGDARNLRGGEVNHLTGTHIWEYLGRWLFATDHDQPTTKVTADYADFLPDTPSGPAGPRVFESTTGQWSWTAPDLRAGSVWSLARVHSLFEACKGLPDRCAWIDRGLAALEVHRQNYGTKGPQKLQILWWEFPPERWRELREGCSMNFLRAPPAGVTPNSPMDEAELQAATEFVDELVSLGVLRRATAEEVEANGALFTVLKPGQTGQETTQYRVISDMKAGGQNICIGRDPVFLNKAEAVLPQLYSGGYSALADASKMFYQFPTRPDEYRYLGLLHPMTGDMYVYCGLPMGSANSPAVAGRAGYALIRSLTEDYPAIFGSQAATNTWLDILSDSGVYDERLGHGYRIHSPDDDLPAVLVFCHVDDFLIHGPTFEKTSRALTALMDKALRVGFLFNPSKVKPPRQTAKYCGFIYDTTGHPTLRIPEDKRDRALTILDYVLSRKQQPLSRLGLSVLYGTLQSLVPASNARIGQTFLRESYDSLYEENEQDSSSDARWRLYTCTHLSPGAIADLEWWCKALRGGLSAVSRSERAGTLVTTFGDGSGTGSGGTLQTHHRPAVQWMGQWLPHVHFSSSNWKELRTLVATLERILESGGAERVRGTTVFYFTDNSTTYFCVQNGSSKSPGLHALIRKIKLVELQLGCRLVAIHVPGVVLIGQGTDGLSRGVWVSPLQADVDPAKVSRLIFAAVPNPVLWPLFMGPLVSNFLFGLWLKEALDEQLQAGPGCDFVEPPPMRLCDWRQRPRLDQIAHRHTLWCPPPELTQQLISSFLTLWIEEPWDTCATFVVPRVLQHEWGRISKHVSETDLLRVTDLPTALRPELPIPIVVLHIRSHLRSLPLLTPSELELPAVPPNMRWHREQAELLRRMP